MVMQDDAVSEVMGTLLLFVLVSGAVGVLTLFAACFVLDTADTAPTVSFRESASPNYLYHAGGDTLLQSEIRIYSKSTDITDKTRINGEKWTVWKTGDALYLTAYYKVTTITIVGRTSSGREVILYDGLKRA